MAQKEREERKKLEQEINNFRLNYQRKEDRREFDLNDPNYIKKSLPARLRDDDPRCGISSAQKYFSYNNYDKLQEKLKTICLLQVPRGRFNE